MTLFEQSARAAKGAKLSDSIWIAASDERRRDPELPWEVSQGATEWWAMVAEHAGVKLPSEITRAAVVMDLALRVNAERRGTPEPCDASRCHDGTRHVRGGGHGDPEWDGEAPCDECNATGKLQCHNCAEAVGTVVTPLGLYCASCCAEDYPVLARHTAMLSDPFAGLTQDDARAAGQSQPSLESAGHRRRVG